jgi:hypothetical protein
MDFCLGLIKKALHLVPAARVLAQAARILNAETHL